MTDTKTLLSKHLFFFQSWLLNLSIVQIPASVTGPVSSSVEWGPFKVSYILHGGRVALCPVNNSCGSLTSNTFLFLSLNFLLSGYFSAVLGCWHYKSDQIKSDKPTFKETRRISILYMFNVESLVPIAPWSKDQKFHGKTKQNKKTPCFHSSCSGGPKPKVWAMRSFWKLCEETYRLPTSASGAAHIPGRVSSDSATMSPLWLSTLLIPMVTNICGTLRPSR